jgi:diguanylate cyclase
VQSSSPGPVPSPPHRLPLVEEVGRRLLPGLMLIALAGYTIGLMKHGPDFEPLVDGWLGVLTQALPAAICWFALPTAGTRRLEIAVLAAAMTAFTAGNLVFILAVAADATVVFPSQADLGFLSFYPLALIAIGIAARREFQSDGGSAVWLDSLLGGLGAAAVLAVVLDQVFEQGSGRPLASGVALIYPIFDLLLIAAVIGIASMQGRQVQLHWLALLAGLAVFACIDVLSAVALASDSYNTGGATDALWPTGLALMSLWALARASGAARHDQPVALVVPGIAIAASLGVLVASGRTHVSTLAVSLATLTLIATAGRTQLAFQQLRRLADLRRQASTDELTGLANRRAFYNQAEIQLALPGRTHALLLLDLDRFKEVNDSLGHQVGDQLLHRVGGRLREQLRDGDLLARLGGDEFAVLLIDASQDDAVALAIKLRVVVAMPCTLEGIALRTDVSIGLTFAPEHGRELSGLLRGADIAMYKAKRAREGYRIYSADDATAGVGRLRSIQELHVALVEEQLTLHYQPKVDLATNEVHDVEALVRWDHPTQGLLYPDSFLGLVEDAGLMAQMTEIVLTQALDQAAIWRDQGRPLTVAVNLSASSLVDADLPEQVGAMLAVRNLPAGALQLEITEEFLMADRDRARDVLVRLREQGIQISVDDFGTGYSSLAYLRELPIDELKLDRSFVFPMADDARAAALVFSTIGLAHSLGLRMVAEGVESQAALTELIRHGCDQAQGYFISRPLPAAELDHWLEQLEPTRIIPLPG